MSKARGLDEIFGVKSRPIEAPISTIVCEHLSPLQYPGGKTWFVPRLRHYYSGFRPRTLIECFAGGASVGLDAILSDRADRVILIDANPEIVCFWAGVLYGAPALVEQIRSFTEEQYEDAVRAGDAFSFLLRNRTSYGGAVGKAGKPRDLFRRWYPDTLIERVQAISAHADRFTVIQGDALDLMLLPEYDSPDNLLFIDPPYYAQGKTLYPFSRVDHDRILRQTSALRARWIVTYDDVQEIAQLCERHGLPFTRIAMTSNKNKRMQEIVACRDLTWL